MKLIRPFTLIVILFTSFSINADVNLKNGLFEQCRKRALQLRPGQIVKVEFKIEYDMQVYEFDIRDQNNQDWEIECAAATGEIVEIEEEVYGVSAPRFAEQMTIGYNEAKQKALALYPGEMLEMEYEIEEDGVPVYEFDIQQANGEIIKIEINAMSGEPHDLSRELWQIGYE